MNNDSRFAKAKTSLGHCINSGDFIGRFYELFRASDSEVDDKFANTDMDKQKKQLMQGINLAIMFAEGDPLGKHGIDRIRRTHSKKEMDIPPAMYSVWLDCFVQTLREFDEHFDGETEQQWRDIFGVTIDHIISGYNE